MSRSCRAPRRPPRWLARRAAAGALLLAGSSLAAETAEPTYVPVTLRIQGRILAARFHDVDGDGRQELTLAVWSRTAQRREIHVHRPTADGLLATTPDPVVPVLKDVVAFCWADVRDEPGDELVFLTRSGAWSFSITRSDFRGNFLRLVDTPLLYDVPDPGTLPHWDYVFQLGGRDVLLLPDRDGFAVWGPGPAAASDGNGDPPAFVRLADFVTVADVTPATTSHGRRRRGSLRVGEDGFDIMGAEGDHVLLDAGGPLLLGSALVSTSWSHRSPALVDVDGDGDVDLLRREGRLLHVYPAEDGVIAESPARSELYPAYLEDEDASVRIAPHDLDADGDVDLLVRIEREEDGALRTNSTFDFLVLLNDGARLLPEQPHQILRLEGTEISASVADVNGDRRPDLVVTKMQAPSLLEISGPEGLTFTRSTLVYFGDGRGRFSKKPDLAHEDRYDESTIGDAIVARSLAFDCSGDGRADLVDVDLQGHVAIQRVVRESGFFGGESWKLERTPWKRFPASGSVANLEVRDVNGDGLGGILSWRAELLTVLLSRPPGARR